MKEEMESHNENGTWMLVEKPKGAHILGCRWVLQNKCTSDGTLGMYKAGLVAKGLLGIRE